MNGFRHSKPLVRRTLQAIGPAMLAVACSGPVTGNIQEGEVCGDDKLCASGLLCDVNFICRIVCNTSADCPAMSHNCSAKGLCMPGRSGACGNGIVEDPEECDDGNRDEHDGCSSTCVVENGWSCEPGNPRCAR